MTNHKDTDLREALRRRYSDTPQLSADFADRLRQRIEEQAAKPKHHRVWLYSGIAAAASVALLIALHKPQTQPTVPTSKEVVIVDWYAMNGEQGILEKQYSHQREIQEKGERLIAHIQQQKITEK
ncbi:MAG: hypothetical protein II934_00910 [Prevotella sp.]|nr:hypothetical protein [Prevotella sp.]